jgi:hypothetical protein
VHHDNTIVLRGFARSIIRREFGADAFGVERVTDKPNHQPEEVHA